MGLLHKGELCSDMPRRDLRLNTEIQIESVYKFQGGQTVKVGRSGLGHSHQHSQTCVIGQRESRQYMQDSPFLVKMTA